MLAEGAQETVHSADLPQIHESHKKIVIHRKVVAGIDVSSLFKQASTPEACFLGNEIPAFHPGTVMRRHDPIPQNSVVFVNGAPAGYIIFELKVDSDAPAFAPTLAQTEVHSYQKPFLSYAHEDREEVLKAAQLLRALKIDCFQDLLSLAPGEQFEERLFSEIEHCDVFLLFWSHNAQNSKWVIREAEYALQRSMRAPGRKALDIIPVLLEGPPPPIPPASLGKINFSDPIRHIIFAEENSQKEQRQKEHDKLERAAALRAFNEKTGPWLYPLLFFGGIFLLTAILIATR